MSSALMRQFLAFISSLLLVLLPELGLSDPAQVPLYLSVSPTPPNIMMIMDTSGSMGNRVTGSTQTRMAVAISAAKVVVDNLTPLPGAPTTARFGLTVYNSGTGGKLLQPLIPLDSAATATSIKNKINGLVAGGVTPLATTLSDVGYYFSTGYNFPDPNRQLTLPAHGSIAAANYSSVALFRKTTDTTTAVKFLNFTPPTAPTNVSTTVSGTVACPLVNKAITPADMPANYVSGCGALLPKPTGGLAGGTTATATDAITPVQMVVVNNAPTFCMTDTSTGQPACTNQTVFHIGSGLQDCPACTNGTLSNPTRETIAIATNPDLGLTSNTTGTGTTPSVTTATAATPLAINGTVTVNQTFSPAITPAPTIGYTLSDTFLSPSGTLGTTGYNPGVCRIDNTGLLTGLGNGKCRVCGNLGSTTRSTYGWTGGTGTAANPPAPCDSNSAGTQYCPAWNGGSACSKSTDYYYIDGNGIKHNGSAPNRDDVGNSCYDVVSGSGSTTTPGKWCAVDANGDGTCGDAADNVKYNCLQCSCFPAATCTNTSNKYCSNGSLGACGSAGGNCCSTAVDCYDSTCEGICANATNTDCQQDSTCYDSTCNLNPRICSNNQYISCTGNTSCNLGTCNTSSARYFCLNDPATRCRYYSGGIHDDACQTNGMSCSDSVNVCSNNSATKCPNGASDCTSGISCNMKCSGSTGTSCTTDATCSVIAGTCSGLKCSGSPGTPCTSDATCSAVAGSCTSLKCSGSPSTSCTSDTTCSAIAGTCNNMECSSRTSVSCTSNSTCIGTCTSMECSNNSTRSCTTNSDCQNGGTCGVNSSNNRNGVCSNDSSRTCSSLNDTRCSFGTCGTGTCSNSSGTTCTATNVGTQCSYGGTCSVGVCSNNSSTACTTSNAGTACSYGGTCSVGGTCSNNGSTSCTAANASSNCSYGGTCSVGQCSNDATRSCSVGNVTSCVTCGGTGNTRTVCSNSNINNGDFCTSLDDCDTGLCSNANTPGNCTQRLCSKTHIPCTQTEGENCTNSATNGICVYSKGCSTNADCTGTCPSLTGACSASSSVAGIACTLDSTCNPNNYCTTMFCKTGNVSGASCDTTTTDADCNPGVACNTCSTITPATCTATTAATSCATSQLDVIIGDGTYAGNTGGGPNNTGGTVGYGYFCFDDNRYYTVQYNGGADPVGPYTGAQLNWYFSQQQVPNSNPAISPAFYEGSLEMPTYTVPGDTCTCTCTDIVNNTNSSTSISCPGGVCSSTACPCAQSYSDNLPIQKWCQKSFVVLVSDGLPNQDRTVNPLLRNYTADCCDGTTISCTNSTTCDVRSNTLQMPGTSTLLSASSVSSATCPLNLTPGSTKCNKTGGACNMACQNGAKANRAYETGGSDYLDDVAKALYEMDLRPDLGAAEKATSNAKNNIITYTIGFDDPSVTGGSTTSVSVLEDAARVAGGEFYPATGASGLADALNAVRTAISAQIGSSASVATNSTQVGGDTMIYQAKFDSGGWFGDLNAYAINLDGGIGSLQWDAATRIPAPNSRTILTYPGRGTNAAGTIFEWASLTDPQQNYLKIAISGNTTTTGDTLGQLRLAYIRGDATHEVVNTQRKLNTATGVDTESRIATASNPLLFRNRTRLNSLSQYAVTLCDILYPEQGQTCPDSVSKQPIDPWRLGDIVFSNPAYVSTNEDYGYGRLPEGSTTGTTTYAYFVRSKRSRRPMVYVGANDGMLHGFDGSKSTATAGQEIMAYIPNVAYPGLANFTSPYYNHQYFVNGSPMVGDAYLNNKWRTVLVATTGAGAKSVFALDITNPGPNTSSTGGITPGFTGTNVLWEVSTSDSPNTGDLPDTTGKLGFVNNLGYTISQPVITRTNDEANPWVALVANGYYSTSNKAILYVLNLYTGAIIRSIEAVNSSDSTFTSNNGLSSPFAADINSDTKVDYVYAGDLRGNMWKFDFTSASATSWAVANSGSPLYVACAVPAATRTDCSQTNRQSISTRPVVGLGEAVDTYMVYFGTGKYFDDTDNSTSILTQTFYGIIDSGTTVPSSGSVRGSLQPQTITGTTTSNITTTENGITSTETIEWRTTSNNTCGDDKEGWFMDLPTGGERVSYSPILRDDRVIFTTLIPTQTTNADSCTAVSSGTGWLMELAAMCGTPTTVPPWDTNGDRVINDSDIIYSGRKSSVGIPTTPGILRVGTGVEAKYVTGSTGKIEDFKESSSSDSSSYPGAGRQSWRQIR